MRPIGQRVVIKKMPFMNDPFAGRINLFRVLQGEITTDSATGS